jgi:hypothetical protein
MQKFYRPQSSLRDTYFLWQQNIKTHYLLSSPLSQGFQGIHQIHVVVHTYILVTLILQKCKILGSEKEIFIKMAGFSVLRSLYRERVN